jgi:hypothetical protein
MDPASSIPRPKRFGRRLERGTARPKSHFRCYQGLPASSAACSFSVTVRTACRHRDVPRRSGRRGAASRLPLRCQQDFTTEVHRADYRNERTIALRMEPPEGQVECAGTANRESVAEYHEAGATSIVSRGAGRRKRLGAEMIESSTMPPNKSPEAMPVMLVSFRRGFRAGESHRGVTHPLGVKPTL